MATEQMKCPECGEDAVNTPGTDRVPWTAHGTEQPQWSHKDGSSLCPVIGDSGYVPAQPRPRAAEQQSGPGVSRQQQMRADAGMALERTEDSQDEIATRLLDDPATPESQAYARAFSDTAAAHVRELRERDPLPEPDRTPGTPHPDPFLAERGWHVKEQRIYSRRPKPHAELQPEKELEAG